jgi:hypothetical protein
LRLVPPQTAPMICKEAICSGVTLRIEGNYCGFVGHATAYRR